MPDLVRGAAALAALAILATVTAGLAIAAPASADERRPVDAWAEVAGVALGERFAHRGDRAAWKTALAERALVVYAHAAPLPRIFDVDIDALTAGVSKRLGRVVLIGFVPRDRAGCAQVKQELTARFGEAAEIGRDWVHWQGARVGVEWRDQGARCFVQARDLRYDDTRDQYRRAD